MNTWPKSCRCGREYTPEAWAKLPFVGVQQFEGDDVRIELRNCACDSTLGILVEDAATDEAA